MEEFVNFLSTPEGSIVAVAVTSVTMITIVNVAKNCNIGVKAGNIIDIVMDHVA